MVFFPFHAETLVQNVTAGDNDTIKLVNTTSYFGWTKPPLGNILSGGYNIMTL